MSWIKKTNKDQLEEEYTKLQSLEYEFNYEVKKYYLDYDRCNFLLKELADTYQHVVNLRKQVYQEDYPQYYGKEVA